MDVLGTTTVACQNSATCGGQIQLRLLRKDHINPDGSTVTTFEGDRQSQTCRCNYSEEEVKSLLSLARVKLGVI
jgi:hypothetical protein